MCHLRSFAIITVLFSSIVLSNFAGHTLRTIAQENESMYSIMLMLDAMDFVNGVAGTSSGCSNYFKWHYAAWRNSPERTLVEKIGLMDKSVGISLSFFSVLVM